MSMDAMGASSWKQPRQPSSNHNPHKHNWNFIERKTTGSTFFRHYYQEGSCVRALQMIYHHWLLLIPHRHRSVSRRIRRTGFPMLSCVPSCTRPLLTDAWKFTFNGRKQQEKLYSKTEPDGANKASVFQSAWVLTVLVPVMRGNVTCQPIGLVVSRWWGLSPLVTPNETEPEP